MKINKYCLCAGLCAELLFSPTLMAANTLSEPVGLIGNAGVGVGVIASKSRLNTDTDSVIASLEEEADTDTSATLVPQLSLIYTLPDKKNQFFFDFDLFTQSVELGARHVLASGTRVTLSYLPELMSSEEVWQDPYLIGAHRETTDVHTQMLSLEVENITNLPISISVFLGQDSVDEEQSGRQSQQQHQLSEAEVAQLDRNADIMGVAGSLSLPLSEVLVAQSTLTYTHTNASGDAHTNNNFGLNFSLNASMGRHQLIGSLDISGAEYDITHPIFGAQRNDDTLGLSLFYYYAEPFGLDGWTLFAAAGHSEVDANIDFYDSQNTFVGTGMSYHF